MKKSINIWSFYGDWTLEEKMKLAKDAGFEGIELEIAAEGDVSLNSSRDDHLRVRELADKAGLTLSGLATGLYWASNPASNDEATRVKAASILEKQIRAASDLGIDAILVVPGSVGVDFIPDCEELPYDLVWERATALVNAALPLASEERVTICIENVWNKFLLSPLEMRSFVDQFENERAASYFDVGNVLANGYPEHWISILGKRITRVHVKGYRRAVGSVDGFVELLAGDVNWPEVMTALRKTGYSSWVAAEMIPPVPFYKHAPETLIENTSRAMDRIFELGES